MNKPSYDAGVLQALVRRLDEQRLPRLLAIRDSVERGETLGDLELEFLKQAIRDALNVEPLLERHPEHQPLAAEVIGLYKLIIDKALENEKKA